MAYKKWLLPVVIILSLSVLATTVFALTNKDWKDLGKKISNERNSPEKSRVIAKINEIPVNLETLKTKKVMLGFLKNGEISDNEAMEQIKRDIVLTEEANKRNIIVSREDTLKYIKYLQTKMEESIKTNPNSVSNIIDYINGLGMSREEFWSNEDVIKEYQNSLVAGKLRKSLAMEWGYNQLDLVKPEKVKEYENKLERMIEEQKNRLNVEIIQKDLLK